MISRLLCDGLGIFLWMSAGELQKGETIESPPVCLFEAKIGFPCKRCEYDG